MNQTINIRKETREDYAWVIELTEHAFETMEFSDHTEGKLVENLRKSENFIGNLSLVAELNGKVVGHILFTPLTIENDRQHFDSLTLAPVSVLPEFQYNTCHSDPPHKNSGSWLLSGQEKEIHENAHPCIQHFLHKDSDTSCF